MKIAVGTMNLSKINGVRNVVADFFGQSVVVEGFEVPSKVRDMPLSDEEAIEGARNRAIHCFGENKCDLAIGIEGSVSKTKFGLFMTTWVSAIEVSGEESIGAGPQILLPTAIRNLVTSGVEVGRIFEMLPPEFEYNKEIGPMGFLTNGTYSREDAIETAVRMALSPLARKDLYSFQNWGIAQNI